MAEDCKYTVGIGTAGVGALERRYRMTLDFRVLIHDIPEGDAKRGDVEEWEREHRERQRRLLRAVLADEAVLREFMTYLVTDRVCGHPDSELGSVFGVKPEEEMLEPVYSKMGEEDTRFFREVIEQGIFWHYTEEFEWSFAVEWTRANLIEVSWEGEGDTTAADRER